MRKKENFQIKLDAGAQFTGSKTDIARWYCKQTETKLFIIPDEPSMFAPNKQYYSLFASFKNANELTWIAGFEKDDDISKPFCPDLETAYEFFYEFFLNDDCDDSDWQLFKYSRRGA